MSSFQGFAHPFLCLRLCTVLPISENSYVMHLNFSVSKKSLFKKPELPGSSSESCSRWACWNTYPSACWVPAASLDIKAYPSSGWLKPWGCRNQVCAPYCQEHFQVQCRKGLFRISSLGSSTQFVEGLTQHLLLFPGWMKAQVFLADSLGLWNCNVSVHVSLCMCLGNVVGPEIFVLRAPMFSGEKHQR